MSTNRCILATLILVLLCSSCSHFKHYDDYWHCSLLSNPARSIWRTVLPQVSFTNTPISEAISRLQDVVRRQTGREFTAVIVDSQLSRESRITLSARHISLEETLSLAGGLTTSFVWYKKNTVVFTNWRRGAEDSVETRILVRGRALDETTGLPLEMVVFLSDVGGYEKICPVLQKGTYEINLWLPAGSVDEANLERAIVYGVNPEPRTLSLAISSPGYSWVRNKLAIEATNRIYNLDIKLRPQSAGNHKATSVSDEKQMP